MRAAAGPADGGAVVRGDDDVGGEADVRERRQQGRQVLLERIAADLVDENAGVVDEVRGDELIEQIEVVRVEGVLGPAAGDDG